MEKPSWISWNTSSGSGNSNITISTTADNLTPYSRSGIITGQGRSGTRPVDVITVIQNGITNVLQDKNGLYLLDVNGNYLTAI